MNKEGEYKVNPIYSLKFQLCVGAIGLLALTLGSVSYYLIERQKQILTTDIQKAIVLQGRNVALSSAKPLLSADPEFELVPLVTRISENSKSITSLVITDADGTVLADMELQHIGQKFGREELPSVDTDILEASERLTESASSYRLMAPVTSLDKTIGHVYMSYSKQELIDSIRGAVQITLLCGALALGLGIILALMVFRRISHPLDVVVEGVNSIAQGDLQARIRLDTRNEFRFLATSFNSMASALLDVQSELVAKKLVDHELEIAHEIQSTLLPRDVQQPDGYEIGVYYRSAMQVGGDYVDVIPLDQHRIGFVMADVSGKGIPGLVVTGMLRMLVHELLKKGMDCRSVVRTLNESLAANMRRNMFVTMFLGILDLRTRELKYSDAGHNPVLLYDPDERTCEFKRIEGRPLALFSDDVFSERLREGVIRFKDDVLVLIYTDGLNESRNEAGEQFGHKRIGDVAEKHAALGAKELVRTLVEAETRFRGDRPQGDDVTLLAVQARATGRSENELIQMIWNR